MRIVIAMLSLIALDGRAEICRPKSELDAVAKNCHDNGYYAEAGVRCLDRLDEEIAKANAAARKSLGENVGATRSAQNGTMGAGATGYNISAETIASLLSLAKRGKQEVTDYGREIYLPDDFGDPEAMRAGAQKFLDVSYCYKRNRDVLEEVVNDFRRRIADLDRALAASRRLESETSRNKAQEATKSSLAIPLASKAPGAPKAVPTGASKHQGSDITGTENDPEIQRRGK
jgi:hypothetical protein